MRSIVAGLALVVACACPPKPKAAEAPGMGKDKGTETVTCDAAKANVTAVYEAEAKATDQANHDPSFVDDNVAMVMKDCAKDPARVAKCAMGAKDVATLEHDCLIPLDEEGTEGTELAK